MKNVYSVQDVHGKFTPVVGAGKWGWKLISTVFHMIKNSNLLLKFIPIFTEEPKSWPLRRSDSLSHYM